MDTDRKAGSAQGKGEDAGAPPLLESELPMFRGMQAEAQTRGAEERMLPSPDSHAACAPTYLRLAVLSPLSFS